MKKGQNGKWIINEWDFPAEDMPKQDVNIKDKIKGNVIDKLIEQIK